MASSDLQYTPLLLESLLVVGESITDQPASAQGIGAEGSLRKFIAHATSAFHLMHGTKNHGIALLPTDHSFTDVATINVVVRAALESFLVFHHVYIDPKDEEERDFRYFAWSLAALLERQKYPASKREAQQKMAEEAVLIAALQERLRTDPCFENLSRKGQTRLLEQGKWRCVTAGAEKSWIDMGLSAGLREIHARHMYRYLAGYAHTGNLSVTQISQATDSETKQQLNAGALILLNISSAFMVKAYAELVPEALIALKKRPELREVVEKWYRA